MEDSRGMSGHPSEPGSEHRHLGHAPAPEDEETEGSVHGSLAVIEKENTSPTHVGIIMDGNRRWAQQHGLPSAEGHRAGSIALENIVEEAGRLGIDTLTVYAFSTENFVKRTKKEVQDLIDLLGYFMRSKRRKLQEQGAKLTILGEVRAFPENLQRAIHRTVDLLKNNERIKLNIALNYGGRGEIVRAIQNIIAQGVEADRINEELISRHLYTCDSEDPDLIIRTGGELRLSNFLIWQASYAEFYFTDLLWPDFTPERLQEAVEEFKRRKRRMGS